VPSLSRKRYLEQASQEYHRQLGEMVRDGNLPAGARNYLDSHAITKPIAMKYRLGYVGVPTAGDERFAGTLAIPYLSTAGVVAIKFRSLSPGGMKYAQASGQKGRPYNAPAYFDAGTTIGISEGEMDAIAATEHLHVPTLGVPGVNGFHDSWRSLFKDFVTVFVFGDGDQPGRDFAAEMSDIIGWRARIVQCPQDEDVSSMCAQGRAPELTALMSTRNDEDET
jgi:hypothetical protein